MGPKELRQRHDLAAQTIVDTFGNNLDKILIYTTCDLDDEYGIVDDVEILVKNKEKLRSNVRTFITRLFDEDSLVNKISNSFIEYIGKALVPKPNDLMYSFGLTHIISELPEYIALEKGVSKQKLLSYFEIPLVQENRGSYFIQGSLS